MSPSLRAAQPGSFQSRLALGLALLGLASCEFEPSVDPLRYELNDKSVPALRDTFSPARSDAVGAQVRGALEYLFGTPGDPAYLILEDWYDDDYDPNAGGGDEIDDEAFDEVKLQNLQRFAPQLELIRARRYAEVTEPRSAQDLWAIWLGDFLPALLEDPDAAYDEDDDSYGTWHEEALYLFESWYPSLRESADLYRRQCLHCHGTDGGGNGPTAEFLDPPPRDYREGKFKWIGVERNTRPRRDDLLSILMNGATFTAMPSFARFSRGELEGLIDYVRLLGIRGEVENLMVLEAVNEEYLPASAALEIYELVWEKWDAAEDNVVRPTGQLPMPDAVTDEMLAHGKELFLGTVANCYTCHGVDGRGNGDSIFEPDEDGNLVIRKDEWGNDSDPRNFHVGLFRGGNRPLDIYRRVKTGISGTIMPAADASLTDDDIWALAYYVLSIAEEHDVNRAYERRRAGLASADHGDGHGADTDSHGGSEDAGHDGDQDGGHEGEGH